MYFYTVCKLDSVFGKLTTVYARRLPAGLGPWSVEWRDGIFDTEEDAERMASLVGGEVCRWEVKRA